MYENCKWKRQHICANQWLHLACLSLGHLNTSLIKLVLTVVASEPATEPALREPCAEGARRLLLRPPACQLSTGVWECRFQRLMVDSTFNMLVLRPQPH